MRPHRYETDLASHLGVFWVHGRNCQFLGQSLALQMARAVTCKWTGSPDTKTLTALASTFSAICIPPLVWCHPWGWASQHFWWEQWAGTPIFFPRGPGLEVYVLYVILLPSSGLVGNRLSLVARTKIPTRKQAEKIGKQRETHIRIFHTFSLFVFLFSRIHSVWAGWSEQVKKIKIFNHY